MRKIHVLLLLGVEAVLLCAGVAVASRNSSGTMSAINGPYVAGTTISSATVNARLADIETELTDSKSRSGKGDFSAPVRAADGAVGAPAWSWTSETGSGFYRNTTNDVRLSINSTDVFKWGTGATTAVKGFASPLGIGNTSATYPLDVGAAVGATQARFTNSTNIPLFIYTGSTNATVGFNLRHDGANVKYDVTNFGNILQFETGSGELAYYTAPSGTGGNTATVTERVRMGPSGLRIGATGTAISASYRGTTSWTPGSITANACATTTISLTGAAAGADCTVTPPSGVPVASVWTSCSVTLNTCNLYQCNADNVNAHTGDSGTYACRVFNP